MTETSSESDMKMDFENTLYGVIGQFGRYQILNVLLAAAAAMVGGYGAGDYLFTAARLPHRCAVPECDGTQPQYAPDWILNAIPSTTTGFDDCSRFANTDNITESNSEVCPAYWFDRNTTISCESYVYERINSVVYDFNLECAEWLRSLPGTLNSAGALIALPLAGYISDQWGRRVSIVFFAFNYSLTGLIRAFSVNYAMYVVLQFLQIAIGGGIFSACYILSTELVGPKYRVPTGVSISTAFALGQMVLGTYAYFIPDWRNLTLVLYTPLFLFLSYFWIISESHRWLITKNKKDEAKSTLERAARLNGKKVSDHSMNYLLTSIPQKIDLNMEMHEENLFRRVIKSRVILRRCCTTPVMWVATTFIYYGLSINSVSLSGNMYLNYITVVAIEIPGFWTAFLLLGKIGRRTTLFVGYMVCAMCCIAFVFTPGNVYGLSLFFYLLGKYCIGMVMTTLYLYTVELYPTRYRHSFLGFSSMLGRIGSILAPLTPPLMEYWSGIPSFLFAGMAIIAAFLVLTQPETRGLTAPDTIEDAEQLGKR